MLTCTWLDELKGDPDEVFLADGLKNRFQLIPIGSGFQEAEMDNLLLSY